MIKSTLKGKPRKLCLKSVTANLNTQGKFGAYKLYFGFKNSLLVKNFFSIGIKVSSRNSASETFFDFNYLL